MRCLTHFFLAVLILCGSLPHGVMGQVVNGCDKHLSASSAATPTAEITPTKMSSSGTCCRMPCCREQVETATAHACCHVPAPSTGKQAPSRHTQGSQQDSPADESHCPGCPGGCCLVTPVTALWFVVGPEVTPCEFASVLIVPEDLHASRHDQPALPPPKITLA